MKKSDVLAVINSCAQLITEILAKEPLSQAQVDSFETTLKTMVKHSKEIEGLSEDDTKTINMYADTYSRLHFFLKSFDPKKDLAERQAKANAAKKTEEQQKAAEAKKAEEQQKAEEQKGKSKKVKKVIPPEKQKEKTKKKRKTFKEWLLKPGLGILIALLLLTIVKLGVDINNLRNEQPDTKPGYTQEDPSNTTSSPEITPEVNNTISININDEAELIAYATTIKEKLPEGSDYSIEDIMYALRLMNFEFLDTAVFENRDEVTKSTLVSGDIASEIGTDSLVMKDTESDIYVSEVDLNNMILCVLDNSMSIDAFASCLTEKGYDIYKLFDLCVKGLDDATLGVNYAKLLNEMMARKVLSFSITSDSPVSTYYTLLGIYNANSKKISELTAGHGWGPIYGDGERIDGTYGFICVEELVEYTRVGNQNNVMYTAVIDDNLLNGPTRSGE